MKIYQDRSYRNLLHKDNLISFSVVVKETDLFVHALKSLKDITKELILKHRGYIEAYIKRYPGVGPMAAVAGAIAEHVGVDLLSHTDEVIVENGGDIFIKTSVPVTIGIFAGTSRLSMRIGLRIDSLEKPFSVCTSSGTVGHSLSLGKADAVCVVSDSCSLADAAATSICNKIKTKAHIQSAIDFGKNIEGVNGIFVIMDDEIGMWGELEVVQLEREKG